MVSLLSIRNRLSAVDNIKQITTCMEMVASARLRKAQDRAKQGQFYIAKMRELLERLERNSTDFKHPLFERRRCKKKGLVVVTSDKGLCGAYNNRIYTTADRFLKNDSSESIELILIGQKGVGHYRNKQWRVRSSLTGWSGKITQPQINQINEALIEGFLSGDLDEIWLVYTKFHTLMDREVVVEPFLPIGKPPANSEEKSINYLFEPNLEAIYTHLLQRYCMIKIGSMLHEAHASELVARIFAMKAAAQNAQDMSAALTLERNKVRQAGITREILETTPL